MTCQKGKNGRVLLGRNFSFIKVNGNFLILGIKAVLSNSVVVFEWVFTTREFNRTGRDC